MIKSLFGSIIVRPPASDEEFAETGDDSHDRVGLNTPMKREEAMIRFMPIAIVCAIGAMSAFAQTTTTGTPQGAGTWTQKAPLPTTRNEVSLATVSGKIYVLGGGINRVAVPHVEEYDPATDKWNARMPMIRGLVHMGTAVVNGKIITVGGFLASVHAYPQTLVYEYDPAANTWRPLAPMKAPRASVGVALLDGKVHAIGGRPRPAPTPA